VLELAVSTPDLSSDAVGRRPTRIGRATSSHLGDLLLDSRLRRSPPTIPLVLHGGAEPGARTGLHDGAFPCSPTAALGPPRHPRPRSAPALSARQNRRWALCLVQPANPLLSLSCPSTSIQSFRGTTARGSLDPAGGDLDSQL
jgi:hypothetical protein